MDSIEGILSNYLLAYKDRLKLILVNLQYVKE
jgi:hypothetical protein